MSLQSKIASFGVVMAKFTCTCSKARVAPGAFFAKKTNVILIGLNHSMWCSFIMINEAFNPNHPPRHHTQVIKSALWELTLVYGGSVPKIFISMVAR